MISLHDQSASGAPVRSLAHRYAVTSNRLDGYAHLPRSAAWHSLGTRRWLAVELLCGATLRDPILIDEPTGAVCGTCLGREQGITVDGIAYAPRRLRRLRKWCPGTRAKWFTYAPGYRTATCWCCGQTLRTWGDTIVQHHPNGRGRSCPIHGDAWLTPAADQLTCVHWVGTSPDHPDGRCHRPALPFWIIGGPA